MSKKNPTILRSVDLVSQRMLWEGAESSEAEIDLAVERAEKGLRRWQQTPLPQRIDVVRRFADYLNEHRDRLAKLISDETGKLIADSSGEVAASIAKVEASIQALHSRRDERIVASSHVQRDDDTIKVDRVERHRAIGVVLVLGPFNFPLHLPGGQIIPALLAGNTVVFKPSELATAVGAEIIEAWRHSGLPNGCLEMLTGGAEVAKHAIESPSLGAVMLTGSRQAGVAIHQQLAGRPEVLLALELGGNNPMIIDAETSPADVAELASFSAFVSAGQRCTCARRLVFIEGESTDLQIQRLVEKTKSIRAGYPDDVPAADIGRLISKSAADRFEQTYEELIGLGCSALSPLIRDPDRPSVIAPVLLDGNQLSCEAMIQVGKMEWFGPMTILFRAKDLDAAIQMANQTPYGLAASLLSRSRERFDEFASRIAAGVVNWNAPTTGAAGVLPFGGLGHSGNHRPAGFHAIDFCTDAVASLQAAQIASGDPWETVR